MAFGFGKNTKGPSLEVTAGSTVEQSDSPYSASQTRKRGQEIYDPEAVALQKLEAQYAEEDRKNQESVNKLMGLDNKKRRSA